MSSHIARKIVPIVPKAVAPGRQQEGLSPRESQVLELLSGIFVQGNWRDTGIELCHRAHPYPAIFMKSLHVRSRTEAARSIFGARKTRRVGVAQMFNIENLLYRRIAFCQIRPISTVCENSNGWPIANRRYSR